MRIIQCLILGLLIFWASPSLAEFTVDERSLLHFGASAGIGYTVNSFANLTDNKSSVSEKVAVFAICSSPGLAKEFMIDSQADYGDLAFNTLGCLSGMVISDFMWVSVGDDKLVLNGRW